MRQLLKFFLSSFYKLRCDTKTVCNGFHSIHRCNNCFNAENMSECCYYENGHTTRKKCDKRCRSVPNWPRSYRASSPRIRIGTLILYNFRIPLLIIILKLSQDYERFDWDESTQGLILGSFYIGYVTTHVPGGYLSDRFGGKYTLGIGVLLSALLTLLVPPTAKAGYQWLVVARVFTGMGEVHLKPFIFLKWKTKIFQFFAI